MFRNYKKDGEDKITAEDLKLPDVTGYLETITVKHSQTKILLFQKFSVC